MVNKPTPSVADMQKTFLEGEAERVETVGYAHKPQENVKQQAISQLVRHNLLLGMFADIQAIHNGKYAPPPQRKGHKKRKVPHVSRRSKSRTH